MRKFWEWRPHKIFSRRYRDIATEAQNTASVYKGVWQSFREMFASWRSGKRQCVTSFDEMLTAWGVPGTKIAEFQRAVFLTTASYALIFLWSSGYLLYIIYDPANVSLWHFLGLAIAVPVSGFSLLVGIWKCRLLQYREYISFFQWLGIKGDH